MSSNSTILVTGSAGFIGAALTLQLLRRDERVVGFDNHNNYYDPSLKEARLKRFLNHPNYTHIRGDLSDRETVEQVFETYRPKLVVNLAAQAGVRYAAKNPHVYVDSNVTGFLHILEGCRHYDIKHLVFASSSSVYGANKEVPFSIHHNTEHPLSLYAATKKANEMMAHSYANLYRLPSTGIRFFTVYGPWGRPDMALFLFTESILKGRPIKLFNYGNHQRDFTYIDDIVEGIIRVLDKPPTIDSNWDTTNPDPATSIAPYQLYNIGSQRPVSLLYYVELLENYLGAKAQRELLPLQPGDIPNTYANIEDLVQDVGFYPQTSVEEGVANFVDWYRQYYGI